MRNSLRFSRTADSNHPANEGVVQAVSIRDRGSASILESRLRARPGVQVRNQGGVVIG